MYQKKQFPILLYKLPSTFFSHLWKIATKSAMGDWCTRIFLHVPTPSPPHLLDSDKQKGSKGKIKDAVVLWKSLERC